MSSWGEELDPFEYEPKPNAECTDCGTAFVRSEYDRCPWCADCAIRRDQWASLQDIKTMARAVLTIDPAKIKDIA